jgi:hypothetical protein
MIITSSGNVGIGTNNPVLENGGGQVIYNSTVPRLAFRNSTSGTTALDGTDLALVSSDFYVFNREAGQIIFGTSGLDRMRITSGGQITVLSNDGIVVGANGRAFIREKTGGDAEIGSPLNGALFLLANGSNVLSFSGGAATFSSLGTGSVTATAGTLSTVSDLSYKIEDGFIDSAIEKVLSLKPRYFYWNEKSGLPTNIRQLGFYAQEVNEALGEEVANTPQNKNTPWGISDRSMIAMITKAIQELKQEIDTLKK